MTGAHTADLVSHTQRQTHRQTDTYSLSVSLLSSQMNNMHFTYFVLFLGVFLFPRQGFSGQPWLTWNLLYLPSAGIEDHLAHFTYSFQKECQFTCLYFEKDRAKSSKPHFPLDDLSQSLVCKFSWPLKIYALGRRLT